jgi:membrane fusion protein, copper/silver efflux system
MKGVGYAAAALLLVAGSFAGGVLWTSHAAKKSQAQEALRYACPMHPQYTSDHAGDCPACGMRLEPVRAEARANDPAVGSAALPPGAVRVSAERQQAVGVRLGVVERASGGRTLRTTGRVAPNENATYPIVAGASGWIRDVRMATTGTRVRKNEILASFYAPEFITAQQSYFSGLETIARVSSQQLQTYNERRVAEGVQRQADTLRNLGVSETQLDEMTRDRKLAQDVYVMSPVDGFVLQRNVAAGLRFDRGFEFYRIADLRRVWILTDVYQHQLPFIRPGMTARVTSAQATHPFQATVSRAEPIFDEAALTLKLRLEAANPDYTLKPGMFVDVELPIELPPTLVVPADAIVDSGMRKTVFVDSGSGYFEPRQVETGWRVGDRVEVVKGLMASEHIVISGTFLIDSESRMKAAAQGIFGESAEDPVCGMHVDQARAQAAGRTVARDGATYYFCSDDCRHRFEKDPARYLTSAPAEGARSHDLRDDRPAAPKRTANPAPAAAPRSTPRPMLRATAPTTHAPTPASPIRAGSTDMAKDPVCGMNVVVERAVAVGAMSQRDGRTYYFCSQDCKKTFDAQLNKPKP